MLLDQSDRSGIDWRQLVREQLTLLQGVRSGTSDQRSLLDDLHDYGLVGCFKGPTDLATNPKYMEGFGRNADTD